MLKALSTILFSALVLVVGTLHTMGPVRLAQMVDRLASSDAAVAVTEGNGELLGETPAGRSALSAPALAGVRPGIAPGMTPRSPTIRFASAPVVRGVGEGDESFEWPAAPVCAEVAVGACGPGPRVMVSCGRERGALRGALEEAERIRRRAILETLRARLLAGDADFCAAVTGTARETVMMLPEGLSVTVTSTVVR